METASPVPALRRLEGDEQTNIASEMYVTMNNELSFKVPATQPVSSRKLHDRTFELTKPTPRNLDYNPIDHIQITKSDFQSSEITRTADNIMHGGKISIKEPIFAAEVIEELTSRRIEYMMQREYLKAQGVIDKINAIRDQLQNVDQESFKNQHKLRLQARKQQIENLIKESKMRWKEKAETEKQLFKEEHYNLDVKQQVAREKLEKEWVDPAMQRKFNKQSTELRDARLVEKYMALAGDLLEAERIKRKVMKAEKREVVEKAAKMSEAFEEARDRLETQLEGQREILNDDQNYRVEAIQAKERSELVDLKKRLDLINMVIREEQVLSKRNMPARPVVVAARKMPMLSKTAANVTAMNQMKRKTSEIQSRPLALPPLKVAKRSIKKPKPGDQKRSHSSMM